jgi:hypothetical protein
VTVKIQEKFKKCLKPIHINNNLVYVGNLSFNLEQLDKIRGLASVTNNLIAIRTT